MKMTSEEENIHLDVNYGVFTRKESHYFIENSVSQV